MTHNDVSLFLKKCEEKGIALPKSDIFFKKLEKTFYASDFIFKTLLKYPYFLEEIIDVKKIEKKNLYKTYFKNLSKIVSIKASEEKLLKDLRIFRNKEILKIAWLDITDGPDLFYTMAALTNLADAFLETAYISIYDDISEKYGIPLNNSGEREDLVIIALGKLGGGELNFSSDIDIMFAYPENGINEDFFTKLCKKLLAVISKITEDGFIFRTDTRLRPYGASGPIVMSFAAMEEYYGSQGREWERYALIKARAAAGDKKSGEELFLRLKPFIYRKYLDFSAMETLREMKEKISLEVKKKELSDNIKLGRGGIREIEFFGQMFQMIRGGIDASLQERSICAILSLLKDKKYISEQVYNELNDAYIFMRNTENRLQEFADAQTHILPEKEEHKARIALSLGFSSYEEFFLTLNEHRENVHNHFNTLLRIDEKKSGKNEDIEKESEITLLWQGGLDEEREKQILYEIGFKESEKAADIIKNFRKVHLSEKLTQEGEKRLEKLIHKLLLKASNFEKPLTVLERIFSLITNIQKRICYLALLLENPSALSLIIKFAEESSWIISFLSRHPVMLSELLDKKKLYAPYIKEDLEKDIKERMEIIDADDVENQMEDLRIFKHAHMIRTAAADITETISLIDASRRLTDLSEMIIKKVLELVYEYLAEKHGKPSCIINGKRCGDGFAVIAYGKLGGMELGYHSDLDLVFLHAGEEKGMTDGKAPIENTIFFARLAQRFLHFLSSHTSAGILYKTDMRLRPSGASGLLVSNIDAFAEYQTKNAWVWEHQAIIRARYIAGNKVIGEKFDKLREKVLCKKRMKNSLSKDIIDMRFKMRKERIKTNENLFDLKQGTGGIVDIEFLVQYLTLLYASKYRKIIKRTDNTGLIDELSEAGVLDDTAAGFLKNAYTAYRKTANRLALDDKKALIPEDKFRNIREKTIKTWNYYLEI